MIKKIWILTFLSILSLIGFVFTDLPQRELLIFISIGFITLFVILLCCILVDSLLTGDVQGKTKTSKKGLKKETKKIEKDFILDEINEFYPLPYSYTLRGVVFIFILLAFIFPLVLIAFFLIVFYNKVAKKSVFLNFTKKFKSFVVHEPGLIFLIFISELLIVAYFVSRYTY